MYFSLNKKHFFVIYHICCCRFLDLEKVLNDDFLLELVKEIITNPNTTNDNDLYDDSDRNGDIGDNNINNNIGDTTNNEDLIINKESLLQDDLINTSENGLRACFNETECVESDEDINLVFKDPVLTSSIRKHDCDKCGKSYKVS